MKIKKITLIFFSILMSSCKNDSMPGTIGIQYETHFNFYQFELAEETKNDSNEIISYKFQNVINRSRIKMKQNTIVAAEDYINFDFSKIKYIIPDGISGDYVFTKLCISLSVSMPPSDYSNITVEKYFEDKDEKYFEVTPYYDLNFFFAIIEK